METLQNLLIIAIEATAVIGISGIFAHALFTSHCKWKATYCPPVAPFQEEAIAQENQPIAPEVKPEVKLEAEAVTEVIPAAEAVTEVIPAAEAVTEVIPAAEAVKELVKPHKTRNKKAPQFKLQPMSVGAAAVDYSAMTSEQLRKECALQGIDWRSGGDYGKPMKKAQMLAALR
jgi:hypothetical protein